jgi:hypothetical protein
LSYYSNAHTIVLSDCFALLGGMERERGGGEGKEGKERETRAGAGNKSKEIWPDLKGKSERKNGGGAGRGEGRKGEQGEEQGREQGGEEEGGKG